MRKIYTVALLAFLFSTAAYAQTGKWQQLDGYPDCSVWNGFPEDNETVTWSGTCVDGYTLGEGELVWRVLKVEGPQISIYIGNMQRGKLDGKGVYTWPNGLRYEGSWKKDNMNGYGILYNKRGNIIYKGDWIEDEKSGYGVQIVNCPKPQDGFFLNMLQSLACGIKYEGNWRKDLPNGEGTLTTAYWVSFSGNWVDGCMKKFFFLKLSFGKKGEACKYE